jgi:fused signal recognition particle receptor
VAARVIADASAAPASARKSPTRRSTQALADEIAARSSTRSPSRWRSTRARKPHVVLVVGVNGTGKTTTIGKLAHSCVASRASARARAPATRSAPPPSSSCQVWGQRTGAPVDRRRQAGADAAGLAFDALAEAPAPKAPTSC